MGKKDKQRTAVFNHIDLVKFVWKNKNILIVTSLAAFIISVIAALTINPRYRSTVVLFPAASVSLSDNLAESSVISVNDDDILSFGDQAESERMLQLISSARTRDYIVGKYNLMGHYEIDLESAFPYTQLNNKYNSNFSFRRTKYNSIEISVIDEDAQLAADMANDIAAYIDSIVHTIQLERATGIFRVVENEYLSLQEEIAMISDTLENLRALGILDYQSQAASMSQAYANALAQGNYSTASEIKRQTDLLARYGGKYMELSRLLENDMERLGQLKARYQAYKINIDKTIPQAYIVDRAEKAERKALPDRSMIVMISVLSTFILTFFLLLIADYIKSLK